MVADAATQVLLSQAPQALDHLTTAFGLTGGERQRLLSAQVGEGCWPARAASGPGSRPWPPRPSTPYSPATPPTPTGQLGSQDGEPPQPAAGPDRAGGAGAAGWPGHRPRDPSGSPAPRPVQYVGHAGAGSGGLERFLQDPWATLTDLADHAIAQAAGWGLRLLTVAIPVAAGMLATRVGWRRWRHQRLVAEARLVQILPPPQVEPAAAEAVWANLAGLLRQRRPLDPRPHVSFELTWTTEGVTVGLWVPGTVAPRLVERAVEAGWPGARTRPTPTAPPPWPIGNPTNPRAIAQHYIGWALVAANRIAEHTAGNGAAIVRAVQAQGIGFGVAATWPGSRTLERQLKNRKCAPPLPPHLPGTAAARVRRPAEDGSRSAPSPFPPHPWSSAGPGCHQPVGNTPGLRRRLPTSSGCGVGALGRRSPLRTDRTRLLTAHHIHEAAAVAAVGLFAVQLLDLLAVPSPPGQPPPPSGDPGPQAVPDHDDHQGHAQSAQPPPPTSTPRPPATPGHDHHVLPFHRLQAASIARRQKAPTHAFGAAVRGPDPARPGRSPAGRAATWPPPASKGASRSYGRHCCIWPEGAVGG